MPPANYTELPRSVGTCFDAQMYLGFAGEYGNGTQLNTDLGGAIIACSYMAINILLPFLFVWSEDVTPSVFLFFSQTIPVLAATLSSINSDNLSLFDAHFAAAVTGSPLAFYIAASCMRYPFRANDVSLFRKVPSRQARILICIMGGLLFPVLWLSVTLVTSFSSTAFRNSYYCAGMTLPSFLEFLVVSSFTGVLDIMGRRDLVEDFLKRRGLGFVSILFMLNWAVYLVRHREEISQECMAPIKELFGKDKRANGLQRLRIAKECVRLGWRVPKISWTTIISHHPSMLVWLLFCLHWSWTLGIANALTFDRAQLLSYGQVLSLAVPIPALWSFGKILRDHQGGIIESVKTSPSFVRQGVCFTFTGRNEWSMLEEHTDRDYFHWSRLKWIIILLSAVVYLGLHAVWILFYVLAGSMPNTRNRVNEPHKNWKPYSVCMYINGYFCSVVCIFLAVAFFDYLPKWRAEKIVLPVSGMGYGGFSNTVHLAGYGGLSARFKDMVSRRWRLLRPITLILSFVFIIVLCVSPIFAPPLGLALAQEWHWRHDCDTYPVEMVLNGQPKPFEAAVVSIYVSPTPDNTGRSNPPQRTWVYNFKLYAPVKSLPNLRVLEYLEPSQPSATNVSPNPAPLKVKSLVLDTEKMKFLGCSDAPGHFLDSEFNTTAGQGSIDSLLAGCTEGSGTYETRPYLRFAITPPTNNPNSIVYLQSESKEWSFANDAPSVLLRSVENASSNSASRELEQQSNPFRTALTKRNYPTILKVCADDVNLSVETLGPLSVVLDALNRFAVFISRPRVLSDG